MKIETTDKGQGGARLPCCVPFCRCTSKPVDGMSEWICARHWRLLERERRRLFNVTKKAYVAALGATRLGDAYELWIEGDRQWKALRRDAIERAMGIGA